MKKYAFCLLFAVVVLSASVITPDVMYASSTRVNTVIAQKKTVSRTVTVTGKIASENEQIQYSDGYYVVSKVLVSAGDCVNEGDNIFSVDVQKTNELYQTQGQTYSGGEFCCAAYSGTVSQILVGDGMVVKESTALAYIIDTDSLCAKLLVGEDVFSYIKAGQKVSISGNAFKGRKYAGKISQIGAVASTDTTAVTTVPVTVEIDKPDSHLKAGFSVKARITVDTIKNAVIIPSYCISSDDKGEYVYVLINNEAVKRYIKTGITTQNGTVITKKLLAGEAVICTPDDISENNENVIAEDKK